MLSLGLFSIPLLVGQATAWKTSGVTEVKKHTQIGQDSLIAFVMPDVESSKALLPEWEKLQKSDFTTVAVSCAKTPEICAELDVVSFPTIRHYGSAGRVTRYRGPRKAAPITSFAHRLLHPNIQTLTAENFTSFSSSDDLVMIASLRPEHNNLMNRFCKLAEKHYDQFSFGIKGIKFEEKDQSEVQCFNNLDGTKFNAPYLEWTGALDDLVARCKELLVPSMSQGNEPKYDIAKKSMVYYFSDDEAERIKYAKMIKPVAQKYSYLQFVTVDSNNYVDLPPRVGISGKKGMSMRNSQSQDVYVYRGKIATDGIGEFIDEVTKNKVKSWSWHEGFQAAEEEQNVHDEL